LKSLQILFRVWKHIFAKNYFENKKFSESLEMFFRVCKHIFGKNYFVNQKIQVSKFDFNMLNFWQNRAEMVLKTDESDGKFLKICIEIKKFSEKFRNIV